MTNVLYINHRIATKCGVYDFGVRHYEILKKSEKFNFFYAEVVNQNEFFFFYNSIKPKIIIFNYIPFLMPWITQNFKDTLGDAVMIEIPHEYDVNNFNFSPLFDYHLILDPSFTKDLYPNLLITDRPILTFANTNFKKNEIINIGSFGFALLHKNFDIIAKHINDSLDNCMFNLHMLEAHFNPIPYTSHILSLCQSNITKPGIIVNHTDAYLSEYGIIELLNKNDINILFYNDDIKTGGISSSLDYLISAQKPILITKSNMFRHVVDKLPIYPNKTISDILNNYEYYQEEVAKIYYNSINSILIQTEMELESI